MANQGSLIFWLSSPISGKSFAAEYDIDTDIQPLDWIRLLVGEAPPLYYLEIGLRILMLFTILLLVVRLLGKRARQNLSPMQQMLMIALGSAAGDVMLYPQIAIGYAALVLVGVTVLTVWLEIAANVSSSLRDYLESRPTVLVKDGEINRAALQHERTTERELFAALRVKGAVDLSQVDAAILEVTGEISVILNESTPSSRGLLDYLLTPNSPSSVRDIDFNESAPEKQATQ